jgi:ribosomal-protein-alanine N-acetyltransferase
MFIDAKIETERLILRPYIQEDAEAIFSMATEPEHFKYQPDTPPRSIEDIDRLIKWSQECNKQNTPNKIEKFNLAIILKKTEEFVGVAGLGPHDILREETELYYALAKKFQGKGIAKEAAKAVFEYGINVIGLDRIIATVHPDNIGSVKIIEALPMKLVKVLDGLAGEDEGYNGYNLYEYVAE